MSKNFLIFKEPFHKSMTKDKKYNIIISHIVAGNIDEVFYRVIDDNGHVITLPNYLFYSVDEVRKMNINKILKL